MKPTEQYLNDLQSFFLAVILTIYFDSATGISKRSFQKADTLGSSCPSSISNLKVAIISSEVTSSPSAQRAWGSNLNQYESESAAIFQCVAKLGDHSRFS